MINLSYIRQRGNECITLLVRDWAGLIQRQPVEYTRGWQGMDWIMRFSSTINVTRWRQLKGIFPGCWRMMWWLVNAPGISGRTDRQRAPNLFQVIFTAPDSVLVDFFSRFVIIMCRDVSVTTKNRLMQFVGSFSTEEPRIYFCCAIIFLFLFKGFYFSESCPWTSFATEHKHIIFLLYSTELKV